MDTVAKLIVGFFSILFTFAVSVMTMIYGWGLEPKNWLVIVVGYMYMILVGMLSALFSKK